MNVRYLPGTATVYDPAFCAAVLYQMAINLSPATPTHYQATEASARKMRHAMHSAGITIGGVR